MTTEFLWWRPSLQATLEYYDGQPVGMRPTVPDASLLRFDGGYCAIQVGPVPEVIPPGHGGPLDPEVPDRHPDAAAAILATMAGSLKSCSPAGSRRP